MSLGHQNKCIVPQKTENNYFMMKHDNFASTPCIFPPTYYCTTQITILKRLRVVKEQKING